MSSECISFQWRMFYFLFLYSYIFVELCHFVLVRVFVNITTSKFEAKRPKFKTLVIYVVLNCDFCGHCLHTKLKIWIVWCSIPHFQAGVYWKYNSVMRLWTRTFILLFSLSLMSVWKALRFKLKVHNWTRQSKQCLRMDHKQSERSHL